VTESTRPPLLEPHQVNIVQAGVVEVRLAVTQMMTCVTTNNTEPYILNRHTHLFQLLDWIFGFVVVQHHTGGDLEWQ